MPPTSLFVNGSIFNTVFLKCYISIFKVPPAIFIFSKSIVCKIDLAVFHIPPAISILSQCRIIDHLTSFNMPPAFFPFYGSILDAVFGKGYLTILYIPVAILIAGKSRVGKISLTFLDMPPAGLAFHSSIFNTIFGKCYLTIFKIPPAIFIFGKSIVFKINLTIFHIPPAILILSQSVIGKIYFSVFHIPPAIFILGYRCIIDDAAVFDVPPTSLFVNGSIFNTVFLKCYISIFKVPPAIFIFSKSIVCKIDLTVFHIPPTIGIAGKSCICKIYFSIFYIPPAVAVIGNSRIVRIDLSVDLIYPGAHSRIIYNTTACLRVFTLIPPVEIYRGTVDPIHFCRLRTLPEINLSTITHPFILTFFVGITVIARHPDLIFFMQSRRIQFTFTEACICIDHRLIACCRYLFAECFRTFCLLTLAQMGIV